MTEPLYRVVANDDERLSLWPLHKDDALGWRDTGIRGTRESCLAEIRKIWVDLRPKRLRD